MYREPEITDTTVEKETHHLQQQEGQEKDCNLIKYSIRGSISWKLEENKMQKTQTLPCSSSSIELVHKLEQLQ